MATTHPDTRPLVMHALYRLTTGGLEMVLVNLINRLPRDKFRHEVVCITDATDFAQRIEVPDVVVHAMQRKPGRDPALHARLWRLYRERRPAIVHGNNIAALDAYPAAAAAGVPVRIHSEHGVDISDLQGRDTKRLLLRKFHRPLIHQFVSVSAPLTAYLTERVGVPPERCTQITNGVDVQRFAPRDAREAAITGFESLDNHPQRLLIGAVGRVEPVKDYATLARAFTLAVARTGGPQHSPLRFALIGDGPSLPGVKQILADADMNHLAAFPGARNDVTRILPAFDLFVQPSLGEGISIAILEALACGLPIVATDVGGTPDLVRPRDNGVLFMPGDTEALARAMIQYWEDKTLRARHGARSRARAVEEFSLDAMVTRYESLYDHWLKRRGVATSGSRPVTV